MRHFEPDPSDRLATGVATLLLMALAGCSKGGGPPAGMMGGRPPPQVTVVTLKDQPVTLSREFPGRTNAYLVADVKIDAVSAQDNDNAISAFAQAQADVASGEAAVANSSVNLAYAHIVAPISGRIGKSAVTQGALVTANQATAMATIQQLDPIYVDVNQPASEWLQLKQEIDSGRVQSGHAQSVARIVLSNARAYPHDGKLQFADVTVDPTTGDFLLRVIVPNPDGLLLPGMFVRAVVDEGVLQHGVLAPQQAIARDAKGNSSALIVNQEGKVEVRPVKVSRTIGNQWLIDEGLAAGDRVIVEGVQKAQPGMPVNAVEASASSGIAGDEAATAAGGGASPNGSK
jgi:membrane fusion protein (multidrug efflux system)